MEWLVHSHGCNFDICTIDLFFHHLLQSLQRQCLRLLHRHILKEAGRHTQTHLITNTKVRLHSVSVRGRANLVAISKSLLQICLCALTSTSDSFRCEANECTRRVGVVQNWPFSVVNSGDEQRHTIWSALRRDRKSEACTCDRQREHTARGTAGDTGAHEDTTDSEVQQIEKKAKWRRGGGEPSFSSPLHRNREQDHKWIVW